jgi:hypothetical protein
VIDERVAVACLVARGETLWMCGDGLTDGFAVARFSTVGPYQPEIVVRFADVQQRAGPDAGAAPPSAGGCGCGVAPRGPDRLVLLIAIGAGLAAWRLRRRGFGAAIRGR